MNGVRGVSSALRTFVFVASNTVAVLYAVNASLNNELAMLLK